MNEFDYDRLRSDLIDYFGTALINEYAMVDLIRVETCSNDELIKVALENNFNLDNYIIYVKKI